MTWTQMTHSRWCFDDYELYIVKVLDCDAHEVMLRDRTLANAHAICVYRANDYYSAKNAVHFLIANELSNPYTAKHVETLNRRVSR